MHKKCRNVPTVSSFTPLWCPFGVDRGLEAEAKPAPEADVTVGQLQALLGVHELVAVAFLELR